MISETYIDFCFIRKKAEPDFAKEIDRMLQRLYYETRLEWNIHGREEQDVQIVLAEIKGMSRWQTEDEAIDFIETETDDQFWDYLQGYQVAVYPQMAGCGNCGSD